MSQKPYVPTDKDRQTVEVLAGFSIPQEKISLVLGISRLTLWKHFKPEIARGSATVEAKLAGNLLRIASGSDAVALKAIMFALTMRFGWSGYQPAAVELGKKAAAAIEAQTAHQDSEWRSLVQ